ncbi:hypothetical protein DWB77_02135 [Streptomyces hundungensis]|uniref:Uncharacterized protein n=1 Tax=Streptomyces hundungensis TaxID=1077946 RepID=A0A387H859_9ACTN|nr:hypothetical protein DWB77_02135 [Streptomyces hundungensis]
MTYAKGDYVFIKRGDGSVLTAGRVQRRRPDGRYKVRKAGSNQVITVTSGRLEVHPQNSWGSSRTAG